MRCIGLLLTIVHSEQSTCTYEYIGQIVVTLTHVTNEHVV